MSKLATQGARAHGKHAARVSPPLMPMASFDASQALLLDVIGQPPVMFHRIYVSVTGSINAALWLSYAMTRRIQAANSSRSINYSQPRVAASDPAVADEKVWFSFTQQECEDGTGLTRHQQDAARRELRQREIIQERRRHTKEIAIDTARLGQLVRHESASTWQEHLAPRATSAANGDGAA
jgi:hypothetical protein